MAPLLALLSIACVPAPPEVAARAAPVAAPAEPVWPEEGAPLRPPPIEVPPGFRPRTVFLVAGHGAPGNDGNLGATCVREQDFALEATEALGRRLDATGWFRTVRARTGEERPSYAARLAHQERSGASTWIELHSDARADAVTPNGTSADGETCWRDDGEPGFTVLVRDRGAARLVEDRLALARALARAMTETGFLPWVGDNYGEQYVADEVPGVWRDRRRLFVLDRPRVPSVIVETHNARDGREPLRWAEERTHEAFGRAVIRGLLAFHDRR